MSAWRGKRSGSPTRSTTSPDSCWPPSTSPWPTSPGLSRPNTADSSRRFAGFSTRSKNSCGVSPTSCARPSWTISGSSGSRSGFQRSAGHFLFRRARAAAPSCRLPYHWRTSMSLRILLADDHVIVRQGLRALLDRERLEVVGEASDGREAVQLAMTLRPEVAVLDLAMPLLNGMDAAREILKTDPRTKVILLTMHTEDRYVLEALRAGVSGYVVKTRAAGDLLQA